MATTTLLVFIAKALSFESRYGWRVKILLIIIAIGRRPERKTPSSFYLTRLSNEELQTFKLNHCHRASFSPVTNTETESTCIYQENLIWKRSGRGSFSSLPWICGVEKGFGRGNRSLGRQKGWMKNGGKEMLCLIFEKQMQDVEVWNRFMWLLNGIAWAVFFCVGRMVTFERVNYCCQLLVVYCNDSIAFELYIHYILATTKLI